ncbi:MAG: Rrf2 family transcriptional regulator [Candidatus Omnitrophota bacterium]
MKLITSQTDYAIRALLFMACSGSKLVSSLELEERLNMPRPFLRKILQILQRKRILYSVKGSKGGFGLALSPDEIFLNDVMNIFQNRINLSKCFFRKKICTNKNTCTLRKEIMHIEQYILKRIGRITLKKLLHKL